MFVTFWYFLSRLSSLSELIAFLLSRRLLHRRQYRNRRLRRLLVFSLSALPCREVVLEKAVSL